MSNHFTYEVDERNLRTQLKGFTIPVSEEAWQKFETFSDSMAVNHRENGLDRFNLTLNRNIVLPSVFGIIIILFSFLLVNFVSIKNPVKENTQKVETQAVNTSASEPKPVAKKTIPIITRKTKSETESPATASQNQESTPEEKAMLATETPPELSKQDINSTPAANPTLSSNSPETSPDSVVNSTQEDEEKARRRAKRRAEAVESQKLLEIRPTPVMEERDTEIRPN